MTRRALLGLLVVACALAAAQTRPDTLSGTEVALAAKQALEGASRNLGRWLTFVVIAVLVAAALATWRIWSLSRQVSRFEDLRSAWETRFTGTADEVLRLKRKLADSESRAAKLETDLAALHPQDPDAATAQVAMVQSELVALRERLESAEQNLEAVADHTVVTRQEREMVEGLVRTAADERTRIEGLAETIAQTAAKERAKIEALAPAIASTAAGERARIEALGKTLAGERAKVERLADAAAKAQAGAEAGAARAEAVARRAAALDLLRSGDERLARQQYPAAVQAYTLCLDSLAGSPSEEPGLRFHALHSRAVANLRQREFSMVLGDAAEIEGVGFERAPGASRLLSGVARLWQGDVEQAIKDFSEAVRKDTGARAAILADEDIAAWIKVNPRKAAPVKQYIQDLSRTSKPHR